MFDHLFSTSAAIQQVALLKSPAGGHKWCPGSIISAVRMMAHSVSQFDLTNPSDIVVFRQHKSSRLQNPTEPEKRSKQQKLSLRTHSLQQLQDRCLMASSSRKGGTWLSRFYHRQVDLVVRIVSLTRSITLPFPPRMFSSESCDPNTPYFTTDAQVV